MPVSKRSLPAFLGTCLILSLLAAGGPARPARAAAAPQRRGLAAANDPNAYSEGDEDRRRLEKLRGLGYVAWDEHSDSSLRGVVKHEGGTPSPGYDLYGDDREIFYLANLDGNKVHAWRVPGRKTWCEHAELLPDGRLLAVCVGQSLMLLDWNSKVVWDLELKAHHDAEALGDGTFIALYEEKKKLDGQEVIFNGFVTVSAKGEITSRWSVFDHREELAKLHEPMDLAKLSTLALGGGRPPKVFDYYHVNAIEALPRTELGTKDSRFREGNIMLSLRNAGLILILDRDTHSPVWHWGEGVLDMQHMPTMLKDGHILVFDNGTRRGFSRVLEIDPAAEKIVWTYEGKPPRSFQSKWRGGNERLVNGDTLICESERGHAFEVTPKGALVWEFWNPNFSGNKRKRLYRYTRYPVSMVEPLLEKLGGRPDPPPREPVEPIDFSKPPKPAKHAG